ncbi:MAG TPA: hypothetical protein VNK24_01360 [Elusimicrobiota bacterium]|nr:hypothetical protein [Elusimicrobiota bacterium]
MTDTRAQHKFEMEFFKDARTFYASTLDTCGNIEKSLFHLKKKLSQSGTRLSPDKWARLDSALRSGEITHGKRSTPGDWAAAELRALKAARPSS